MGNRVKNSAFLWGESTSLPYKGYARGRGIELTTMDVAFLEKTRPRWRPWRRGTSSEAGGAATTSRMD